jgi:2-polyprenyl-3-methyl-5-hydroxy-6-metoxy-1,4-benzoquinol methylase
LNEASVSAAGMTRMNVRTAPGILHVRNYPFHRCARCSFFSLVLESMSLMSVGAIRYDHAVNLTPGLRESVLLDWVGSNKSVLELGCATGYFSAAMANRGCCVTGIEVDANAAKRAERVCERMFVADLNSPCWANDLGTFDVILMADVLEHLLHPDDVLAQCRELLKPDGKIVVSLPNVAHWRNRMNLLLGRWNYTETGTLDRTHLRFFTLQTARRLIEQAGYKIEEFHAMGKLAQAFPNLTGFQFLFLARP